MGRSGDRPTTEAHNGVGRPAHNGVGRLACNGRWNSPRVPRMFALRGRLAGFHLRATLRADFWLVRCDEPPKPPMSYHWSSPSFAKTLVTG